MMMKNWNALKVYKILLDSCWYLLVFISFGWLVNNILFLIANDEIMIGKLFSFPIRVELLQLDTNTFNNFYAFRELDQPSYLLTLGRMRSKFLTDPFVLVYLMACLIAFSLNLYRLKLLRNLLKDVMVGKIFIPENIKRLKLIGITQLMIIPFGLCIYLVLTFLINNNHILDKSLNYAPDYWGLLSSLSPGLEYLIFAGIFSFGLKLKQEQDLTI